MWIDDQVLARADEPLSVEIFRPKTTCLVLGSSNSLDKEAFAEALSVDQIPIFKRLGGGGTVVLYPGCVVVSLGTWVCDHYNNSFYFNQINQALIESLSELHSDLAKLYQDGISDIVYQGKKIAGSSMFRSRNYLLFQCSLLVEPDPCNQIGKYLRHPSKEPDYRQGRDHSDFIAFIQKLSALSCDQVAKGLSTHFREKVTLKIGSHLAPPFSSQMEHIKKKMSATTSTALT